MIYLKLSVILLVLNSVFLLTFSLNPVIVNLSKRYVVFGSVGSGKSTIVKALATALQLKAYVEPKEEWDQELSKFMNSSYVPIIGDVTSKTLHKNKSDAEARCEYAFPLQKKVLEVFNRFHPDKVKEGVFECSPLTYRWTFVELNIQKSNFTKAQEIEYEQLDKELGWGASKYFYLNTSPETCLKQIKNRILTNNQVGDSNYDLAYLQDLDNINKGCFNKLKELELVKPLKVYEIPTTSSLKDLDITINLIKSLIDN